MDEGDSLTLEVEITRTYRTIEQKSARRKINRKINKSLFTIKYLLK